MSQLENMEIRDEEGTKVSRSTRWLSFFGGCFLLVYGFQKLYLEGDWVLVILGVLILAFTVSGMIANRKGGDKG